MRPQLSVAAASTQLDDAHRVAAARQHDRDRRARALLDPENPGHRDEAPVTDAATTAIALMAGTPAAGRGRI